MSCHVQSMSHVMKATVDLFPHSLTLLADALWIQSFGTVWMNCHYCLPLNILSALCVRTHSLALAAGSSQQQQQAE